MKLDAEMRVQQAGQESFTIEMPLDDGREFKLYGLPYEIAKEIARRWNVYSPRKPTAKLWQDRETGLPYYQGPGDDEPQSSYEYVGPLYLGSRENEPEAEPPKALSRAQKMRNVEAAIEALKGERVEYSAAITLDGAKSVARHYGAMKDEEDD